MCMIVRHGCSRDISLTSALWPSLAIPGFTCMGDVTFVCNIAVDCRYVWLGGDGWMAATDFQDFPDGKENPLKKIFHGSIGIFPFTSPTSEGMAKTAEEQIYSPMHHDKWRATARAIDPKFNVPSFKKPYDNWAMYTWDAVVHVARAAAELSDEALNNGDELQKAIRKYASIGATGTVKLNVTTGDRSMGKYNILNINKNDVDILVNVGNVEGTGKVTIDKDGILWATANGGVPSDGDWSIPTETDEDTAIGLGVGLSLLAILLLIAFVWYRTVKIPKARRRKIQLEVERRAKEEQTRLKEKERSEKEKERGLKEQAQKALTDLQNSMQSMMEVKTPWTPTAAITRQRRGTTAPAPGNSRGSYRTALAANKGTAKWYWQEDAHNIDRHAKDKVKAGTNWVEYASNVAADLETHYAEFKTNNGVAKYNTDLTGNVSKVHNTHTGMKYAIHFDDMKQENQQSKFKRSVLREGDSVDSYINVQGENTDEDDGDPNAASTSGLKESRGSTAQDLAPLSAKDLRARLDNLNIQHETITERGSLIKLILEASPAPSRRHGTACAFLVHVAVRCAPLYGTRPPSQHARCFATPLFISRRRNRSISPSKTRCRSSKASLFRLLSAAPMATGTAVSSLTTVETTAPPYVWRSVPLRFLSHPPHCHQFCTSNARMLTMHRASLPVCDGAAGLVPRRERDESHRQARDQVPKVSGWCWFRRPSDAKVITQPHVFSTKGTIATACARVERECVCVCVCVCVWRCCLPSTLIAVSCGCNPQYVVPAKRPNDGPDE